MLNILGEVVSPDVVHPVIRQGVAMGSLASKKLRSGLWGSMGRQQAIRHDGGWLSRCALKHYGQGES